ncbi:conserved hypothetical protein [Gammaproteobacteria bacterium]
MCTTAAAPVLMGVSTGLSVYGGLQAADNTRKAAEANKKYYYSLADTSEQGAKQDIVSGMRDQNTIALSEKSVEASQRAAMAAAGVGSGSVTAEDIIKETFNKAELDKMTVRYNANMSALAKKQQAGQYRMAGDNAIQAGNINADTTLLTSATGVANNWINFGNQKGWFNKSSAPAAATGAGK